MQEAPAEPQDVTPGRRRLNGRLAYARSSMPPEPERGFRRHRPPGDRLLAAQSRLNQKGWLGTLAKAQPAGAKVIDLMAAVDVRNQ